MKQVLQNLRTGTVELADVPCPAVRSGHLLVQTSSTLVSAGTERMLVEFGKAGLIAKARSQPEKVKQVLEKIRTEGLMPTLEAVFARLDEPLPLGYCNAGTVLEVGACVTGFEVGDRVANNGQHAEIVCVPTNLCAKIPDGVTDEQASFTVISAIALQGIRLLAPTLGERIAVIGLGLIGQIAVQLLRASGCQVLGIDLDKRKVDLAQKFGAVPCHVGGGADPVAGALAFSEGRGVDGVLITASAKNNEIIHQAAQMSRKRGRIILVGVIGLELRRSDFYEKELTFQVSCSYGPGRYDASYEQEGKDYPLPYVRWTEQRNFEAVLDMLATKRLNVDSLIDRRSPLTDAPSIYSDLASNKDTLGLVLNYPPSPAKLERSVKFAKAEPGSGISAPANRVVVGVIGAGNYTKLVLLPALAKTSAVLHTIASSGGVSGTHVGRKFGFSQTTTDYKMLLSDPNINTIVITTRHNTHARMAIEALDAGKHVFVEKPLALNCEEVEQIRQTVKRSNGLQFLVGFNRRFSPHVAKVRQLLAGRSEPLCMIMTVNAGHIPPDHWLQDAKVGGGRIIGEACHWIDLFAHLTDAPVVSVQAMMPSEWTGADGPEDKMTISLSFVDGSSGTIHYFANGNKSFPKERLEIFNQQRVLQLDNFRRLTGYGFKGFNRFKTWRVDKGHAAEMQQFCQRISEGGPPLISIDSLINTTLTSFAAVASAKQNRVLQVADFDCTAANG